MESISGLSSVLESTRDLTIEAAQSASAGRSSKSASSSLSIPFSQLQKLLDSRSDRDILQGLRKVISIIYQGKPGLPYFSSVVKNVANSNIQIKKLVYIYLLHYAESDPDLALLSVNAIQKSLTDQSPQVRAMALRTMSGMRVPVISQIVALAIKRGCGDMSPLVRKATALAIPKCYRLDPNTLPQLLDCLSILLGDKQYFVVGPAVAAFLDVCPDRIDLIHKHYRALVRKLVDMDEWSQLATLQLLMKYSRRCFPRRLKRVTRMERKDFYEDDPAAKALVGDEVVVLDSDLELLLKSCKLLLQSRSSSVIISVVSCCLHLGTPDHLEDTVGPLIAQLRSSSDIQQIALYNVVSVALISPRLFVRHASHFLIRTSDPPNVWRLKLELLTIIFPHCGLHLKSIILSELEHFAQGTSPDLIRESVRAIGRCAQGDPRTANRCFNILLKQISDHQNNILLVSEALTVIRHLIQQEPMSHKTTVVRLAKNLDMTTSPEARASIIWLVGEFAGIDPENNIAPDVLRILTSGFADESEAAKQQILLLAAKVYLHYLNSQQACSSTSTKPDPATSIQSPTEEAESQQPFETTATETKGVEEEQHPIPTLWRHILLLTRYDTSYDLRDRARLFKPLLSDPQSTQLASLLLLEPKPVPSAPSPSESRRGLMLGSMTLAVGRESTGIAGLKGCSDLELPDWVAEGSEPDPALRGAERDGDESGWSSEAGRGGHVRAGAVGVAAGSMLDEALKRERQKRTPTGPGPGRATAAATIAAAAAAAAASASKSTSAANDKSLDAWLDESDEGAQAESESGSGTETDTDNETGSEFETDSDQAEMKSGEEEDEDGQGEEGEEGEGEDESADGAAEKDKLLA